MLIKQIKALWVLHLVRRAGKKLQIKLATRNMKEDDNVVDLVKVGEYN
jgi:hypothetical protein